MKLGRTFAIMFITVSTFLAIPTMAFAGFSYTHVRVSIPGIAHVNVNVGSRGMYGGGCGYRYFVYRCGWGRRCYRPMYACGGSHRWRRRARRWNRRHQCGWGRCGYRQIAHYGSYNRSYYPSYRGGGSSYTHFRYRSSCSYGGRC